MQCGIKQRITIAIIVPGESTSIELSEKPKGQFQFIQHYQRQIQQLQCLANWALDSLIISQRRCAVIIKNLLAHEIRQTPLQHARQIIAHLQLFVRALICKHTDLPGSENPTKSMISLNCSPEQTKTGMATLACCQLDCQLSCNASTRTRPTRTVRYNINPITYLCYRKRIENESFQWPFLYMCNQQLVVVWKQSCKTAAFIQCGGSQQFHHQTAWLTNLAELWCGMAPYDTWRGSFNRRS